MSKLSYISSFFFLFILAFSVKAADLDYAPPSFNFNESLAVYADFQKVHKDYTFDITTKKAFGKAAIDFVIKERGMPIIVMRPKALKVIVNGENLDLSLVKSTFDPDRQTRFLVLGKELAAGAHQMLIEFEMTDENLAFTNDAVRVGFFMSDLDEVGEGYGLLERYAPANFEFDRYPQHISFKITGTNKKHILITNGKNLSSTFNEWHYEYPDFFSAGSLYVHLFEEGRFIVKTENWQGMSKIIPITVYAGTQSLVNEGMSGSKQVMAELEQTYGEYMHDMAIAYITPTGGGMEHSGATMTSMWALEHEYTHFWFARGVMPVDGNSGWIDEAIASWRDKNYLTSSSAPSRPAVNLGGFSVYRRSTSMNSYSLGETFMRDLDYFYKRENSNLRAVLRSLYTERKGTGISSADFLDFLSARANFNVSGLFDRYIFGRTEDDFSLSDSEFMDLDYTSLNELSKQNSEGKLSKELKKKHPRRYTKEELQMYL